MSQHVISLSQPLIRCRTSADTELAAEVEPSMETEERLAAEAEAAALRQVCTYLFCVLRDSLRLRTLERHDLLRSIALHHSGPGPDGWPQPEGLRAAQVRIIGAETGLWGSSNVVTVQARLEALRQEREAAAAEERRRAEEEAQEASRRAAAAAEAAAQRAADSERRRQVRVPMSRLCSVHHNHSLMPSAPLREAGNVLQRLIVR